MSPREQERIYQTAVAQMRLDMPHWKRQQARRRRQRLWAQWADYLMLAAVVSLLALLMLGAK